MIRFLILLLIGLVGAAPIEAAPGEQLTKIEADLLARQQQDASLKQQLDKTETELATLRENLVQAAREQTRSEGILADLSDKLSELEAQEAEEKKAWQNEELHMGALTTALLRLSRLPPALLLTAPEKSVDTLRSGLLLRQALPYYAAQAQRLSGQLQQLADTRAAILKKRAAVVAAQQDYTRRQNDLNRLLAQRQNWLKATQSQRADLGKQIAQLGMEAKNVQDLMTKMAAASLKIPAMPSGKDGGKRPQSLHFIPPAHGQLVYGFGKPDDVGSISQGLLLKVKSNSLVVAPADGQVVFAGAFKGYGTIVILRHGDAYHSFLAGFGTLDVVVGQTVNAGEPLGQMNPDKPTSPLYFELRYHGAPVNPQQHLRLVSDRG